MQDTLEPRKVRTPLRYGLLLAVSISALTGCVSAVTTDMRAENTPTPASGQTATAEDPAAETQTATATEGAANAVAMAETAGDSTRQAERGDLVMQPTTLNAGQASIYSAGGQATAGSVPAYTATNTRNAAVNSIYASSGAESAETGRLPVEDMPVPDLSAQQPLPLAGDEQSALDTKTVPVPETARTALVEENVASNTAEQALATSAEPAEDTQVKETAGRKRVTLASLFGSKREAAARVDEATGTKTTRRVINRDNAGAARSASLGVTTLPGVTTAALPASDAHSESEEAFEDDEAPRFKEVASLAGLARLAPNGLWLQTEKVSTGCFKPELLSVLKTVEKHYGKPIIVTSGLRAVKRNRAKQSLHTRCEAADIQIAGVSRWELAEYLRSMPGRGGVGTYCHTESVHIDIGPERDWNWRCRRRK